jgi:hypothetical protein
MLLTAVLIPADESGFVALKPETGTTTQGDIVPEALEVLREATELFGGVSFRKRQGSRLTTFEVARDD